MKALMALAAGCLAVAVGAGAATAPTEYQVVMTSRVAEGQYMALRFGGVPACFGKVSEGAPVTCASVRQVPGVVKAEWGPPSNWQKPGAHAQTLPAGWMVAKSGYRQAYVELLKLGQPRWFRSGDRIVFTLNRMHRLSITYVCREPAHASCTPYQPVTIWGHPQGVAAVTP